MIDRYPLNPARIILGVIITVALLSFCFGVFLQMFMGDKEFKKTAVKAGAAKWVNDPDGDPKFEWIINEENK